MRCLRLRLRSLFRRARVEEELRAEFQDHLDRQIEHNLARGMIPEEARYVALRALGGMEQRKEECRDRRGLAFLDHFAQDLRYAARTLRTRPVFAIIVLTLAVGIGANTAVFSILDAVLLRQLPYRDSGRLVSILDLQKQGGGRATFFDLYTDYENWKKNSKLFEGFSASTWARGLGKILTGAGPARGVPALPVTADYFSLLGVQPALGRAFEASDSNRGCSVVLSHEFWQSIEGGRADLLGKPLRLDDQECTVLGVMPPGFAVYPNPASMLWILLPRPARPDQFGVFVTGRMKTGVSLAAAQTELITLHRQLHEHDRWGALMEPRIYELQSEFTWLTGRNLRLSLIVLFSAVMAVLLICCANVSNLLLGQSLARTREMAVRAAIGSGRGRLLRQLLTESLMLSTIAAGAGVALAIGAVHYFRAANPIDLPPGTVVQVDGRVLLFSVVLSILTIAVFGLVPAWRSSRADLNTALRTGGRSSSQDARSRRFGNSLIVAEVALTIVLLVGAGLLIQSVARFAFAPLGFQPEGLVTAGIRLPQAAYAKPDQRNRFYERLLDGLRGTPGIAGQALSTTLPTYGPGTVVTLAVEGRPDPAPNSVLDTGTQTVSADYFNAMRIPLKRGRFFNQRDRADSEPVTIVNEALAAKYFPGEDPIGEHIRAYDGPENKRPWLRIVGVVGDEKRTTVTQEMNWAGSPVAYIPWAQNAQVSGILILRTSMEGGAVLGLVRRAGGDPDVAVGEVETLPHALAKVLAYPRFRAVLLAAFAGIALLLAVIGLYGVLSRLVADRTHEIGVRMALGARQSDVLATVTRQGMLLVAIGTGIGLVAVWGLTRSFAALLYELSATDPATVGLATLALVASAALATYVPARRATRIDPMDAIRYE